jgi:ribose transport system ATP-binding protein
MVEIAKALSFKSDVLIMDEPTATLTDAEIDELFRIIRALRERGVGIVHISHRLEELKQISDRVTVMRDGRYIDTVRTEDAPIQKIISMMVGRTIFEATPEFGAARSGKSCSRCATSIGAAWSRDVSFRSGGAGLGFAGLIGAGRTEVARAVFCADRPESGEIYVHGRQVHIGSPTDAVRHGIGYLSEDRKRYGLALAMDVETNVVLASFRRFLGVLGTVRTHETRRVAEYQVQHLAIKTPSLAQKARNLSGGTQQKVVVAKLRPPRRC